MILIVSSDGPANVGDLFFDSSPVGEIAADGYGSRLAGAGDLAERSGATSDRRWLAFIAEVPEGFGSNV
jgi:hypothetical protein